MSRQHIVFGSACLASCGLALFSFNSVGQESRSESKGALPMAAAGDQVIVKREATNIEPPHKYKVALSLEPIRSVTLTAPFDGIVRQMDGKPNSKVQAQTDIVRLDNTIAKLKVVRAEAALKIAIAEQKKERRRSRKIVGSVQSRFGQSRCRSREISARAGERPSPLFRRSATAAGD
jgi:multidrug efflux pump subunit AcrA (membrane-fusion protein)